MVIKWNHEQYFAMVLLNSDLEFTHVLLLNTKKSTKMLQRQTIAVLTPV